MGDKVFKVLCIDGGGVRGILPAVILEQMEAKLDIVAHETFDLIVGTSTGSIIAGAIVKQLNLTQLVDGYLTSAPDFFRKRWSACGLCRSKYDHKPLEKFLHKKLGDIKLGEISKPLILNATNVSTGEVHVFKSSYQKAQGKGDYVRDGEVPLYKAVLASCAAPTYFDPVDIDGTSVCDGSIWANNPSLVGYTDAKCNFDAKNIKILSLGTGNTQHIYSKSRRWGFLTGWKNSKMVDFVMSCQTEFPQNCLNLTKNAEMLRINPKIPNYGIDNCDNITSLREWAKAEFTARNREILNFSQP